MLFSRCIYYMPKQSQVDYWEGEWSVRDMDRQIQGAKKKAWWPIFEKILRTEVQDDELVVEAGCGMGQFVYLINQMGKRVMGVDVTEKAVLRAKEAYPELDLQVKDIRDFGLPDESVKLMMSLGVIEHFPEGPDEPLREAARVIQKGGILFITVPFTNAFRRIREPWWRLKYFFLTKRWFQKLAKTPELEFYQYTYSVEDVTGMLRKHGFEVEETLLHHSHCATKMDFMDSWWFKKLHKESLVDGEVPLKVMKAWALEQEQENPGRFAHIALYVARRV